LISQKDYEHFNNSSEKSEGGGILNAVCAFAASRDAQNRHFDHQVNRVTRCHKCRNRPKLKGKNRTRILPRKSTRNAKATTNYTNYTDLVSRISILEKVYALPKGMRKTFVSSAGQQSCLRLPFPLGMPYAKGCCAFGVYQLIQITKKINTEKILVLWGLSGKKKAEQIRDGPATPAGAAGPELHMAQAMLRTAKNYLPLLWS
jgi:hypothetical protein